MGSFQLCSARLNWVVEVHLVCCERLTWTNPSLFGSPFEPIIERVPLPLAVLVIGELVAHLPSSAWRPSDGRNICIIHLFNARCRGFHHRQLPAKQPATLFQKNELLLMQTEHLLKLLLHIKSITEKANAFSVRLALTAIKDVSTKQEKRHFEHFLTMVQSVPLGLSISWWYKSCDSWGICIISPSKCTLVKPHFIAVNSLPPTVLLQADSLQY